MSLVVCILVLIFKTGYVRSNCTVNYCDNCNGDICERCKNGYYKYSEDKCYKCYLFCKECIDGQCYNSGSKACLSEFLEYVNCSSENCIDGAVSCSRCPVGFYSNNDKCFLYTCQTNTCKCTSEGGCTACIPGYYGTDNFCYSKCPTNCTSCTSSVYCTECPAGKYNRTCSLDCLSACPDGTCDIDSGTCITGCPSNHYNHSGICYICPPRCKTCLNFTSCTACEKNYYWGAACEYDCTGCYTTCQKTYGCSEGCDKNYYQYYNSSKGGYECIHCLKTCKSCNNSDNCTVCLYGFYGERCNKTCSQLCKTNDCQQKDGACLHGCQNGYWSKNCTESCSKGCADNVCNQTNGVCIKGCSSKWYGKLCLSECSQHCLNKFDSGRVCNETSGDCVDKCQDGWYGSNCSLPCCDTCGNNTCFQANGTWEIVCTDGTTECTGGGTPEPQTTTSEKQSETLSTGGGDDEEGVSIAVPAGVGGGAAVAVIVIVIMVLLIRRHRREKETTENGDGLIRDKLATEPNAYATIYDTNKEESVAVDVEAVMLNEVSPVILTKQPDNFSVSPDKLNKQSPKTSMMNHAKRSRKQKNANAIHTQQDENNKPNLTTGGPSSACNIGDESTTSHAEIIDKVPNLLQPVSKTETIGESTHDSKTSDSIVSENVLGHVEKDKGNVDEDGNMYYNTVRRRVNVSDLADYVNNRSWDDIVDEFEKLPKGLLKPFSVSQTTRNAAKNRYKLIYPYDESRIVLQDGGNDYVNASFIEGNNRPKEYIAAAGPFRRKDKTETTTDFWRMIWQEKCETIVMLTKCFENAEQKCDQYWPELGENKVYGKLNVTCVTEDQYADFTVRSFIATQDETILNTRQIHFTAWPDKGVPHDVTCLIECRQKVRSLHIDKASPIIVHCSAGIGRTGTFIALDILTFMGEATGYVDIFGCLMNLRQQRVNLVQTPDQYDYLHEAVLHALTFDCKTIPAEEFITYYSTIIKKKDGSSQMEQQFYKLTSTLDVLSLEEKEAIARNKALTDKNRSGADIPSDDDRVRLSQDRKPGFSDYINAVFLNGFKICNKFIVAQTPLLTTVVDFLSMISQSDSSCVVMVENPDLEDKTVGVFWPADNQVIKHGIFQVKCMESLTNEHYTMKKLSITRRAGKKEEGRLVNLFIFTNWPSDAAAPKSSDSLLQLIKDVDRANSSDENERPIIVNCMTGATRSCLYCAVSVLIEKMEIEHEVSVVNTLRQIKSRRRSAFPTLEQYKFCHQAVISYLQTFATYSNFELKPGSKKEVAADAVYATVQK